MKKILTILTTAVLVASMAMPAFAVGFVNSVTGSGSPTFVGGGTGGLGSLSGGSGSAIGGTSGGTTGGATGGVGNVVGGIIGNDGSKKEDIREEQVVIRPVEGSDDQELNDAFEDLKKETPTVSEDLGKQLGGTYTAKDVFKVEESEEGSLGEIAPGESIELTFEVGVDVHTHMIAARFVDGEWVPVGETTNNGDGTVTVATEELGTLCLFAVKPENEELVTITTEAGTEREIVGYLVDKNEELLTITYQECLIVTPLDEIEEVTHMTEEEKQAMTDFASGVASGEISLSEANPALDALVKEKLGASASADGLVIHDLVDVKVICNDLKEHLPPENTTVTLTFDMGVAADAEVFVVTYKHGEVVLAENVVNNGDGTVTATFENFCPVAFLVAEDEAVAAHGTCALCKGFFGAGASPIAPLCMVCFVIIIAVIVAVIVIATKKKKSEKEAK